MISAISKYMPRWLMGIIATALVLATVVGSNQDSAEAIDPADTDTVYIADGTNFADALMGATIASLNTSPMLGVAGTNGGDTIPGDTVEELDRLTNNKADLLDTIYVFGGTSAVSSSVFEELDQWANNVQRIEGDSRWGTYQAISQLLPSAIDEAVHAQEADHATTADSATEADNADTLDGQDSTDFLGATEKAADSELLDGKDSTEFLGTGEQAVDSDKVDGLDANAINRVAHDFTDGVAVDGTDGTDGTAASATIDAPIDGLLVLSGSLDLENLFDQDLVECQFEVDDALVGPDFSQTVDGSANMTVTNMSLDGVEPVASGSHTVNIECVGVDSDTDVRDTFLVVQFVPFQGDGTQPTP